jgi:hypothetical protein
MIDPNDLPKTMRERLAVLRDHFLDCPPADLAEFAILLGQSPASLAMPIAVGFNVIMCERIAKAAGTQALGRAPAGSMGRSAIGEG